MQRMKIMSIVAAALAVALMPLASGWAANKERVLHSFQDNGKDGNSPVAGIIFDKAGHLYGTTHNGGAYGAGTVFELEPGRRGKWTAKVLHNFSPNGGDGNFPREGLILSKTGKLYGVTELGGTGTGCGTGCGTVFELIPRAHGKWTERVLHSFNNNGKDGWYPSSGLIFDRSGNLYATTIAGGTSDSGTVFELMPRAHGKWIEKVLYSFKNTAGDGNAPTGVIFDAAGNLYGTTVWGGNPGCSGLGCGTAFELIPGSSGQWTENVLYSFQDNGQDGITPEGNVIFDAAGNLYGVTLSGGGGTGCGIGCGTVFELIPGSNGQWAENVLYSFQQNGKDGNTPESGVIFDHAGNLYGTTVAGGAPASGCGGVGCGTVFELTP